ncbi:hypothetical protein ES703_115539 [subsurface metagenome]
MSEIIPEGLKESVKEAEIGVKNITEQIRKAKAVGADVRALESELETQRKQIELIKRVYKL